MGEGKASAAKMSSTEVRSRLVEALELDLVGPPPKHPLERELLRSPPHIWYLCGFLAPKDAPVKERSDPTAEDELGFAEGDPAGKPTDDNAAVETGPARKSPFPSSMGLSVLVPEGVRTIEAEVSWGDYGYEIDGKPAIEPGDEPEDREGAGKGEGATEGTTLPPRRATRGGKSLDGWRRTPRAETLVLTIPTGTRAEPTLVRDSDGLEVHVVARAVAKDLVPKLERAATVVSVFLVNARKPGDGRGGHRFAYQTRLELRCGEGFVPRPDCRQEEGWEARLADLHYRDVVELAVGHGVSAETGCDADGRCRRVATTWIPEAEVERTEPGKVPGIELRMEVLGAIEGGAAARATLSPLPEAYGRWIADREAEIGRLPGDRKTTADDLLKDAAYAQRRIREGIELLATDPVALEAFRIANRAMAAQARRREVIQQQMPFEKTREPEWYPFQAAFLLMTLRSIADPSHAERGITDLLFFPTGGGKTEAYLGLAAFAMVLRRLRNPGRASGGVSVLMRYTLRLLTLDQLGRASALMCALELERERAQDRLGEWPFEIGLWVGKAATPNVMGEPNDNNPDSALAKWRRYRTDSEHRPAPIPVEDCPWCGTKFEPDSFRLLPPPNNPRNLVVHCISVDCAFNGTDRHLPILGVDEPIYRRLPAFLIATVDKFAALPWTGRAGTLFGRVDRYDAEGYLGPCDAGGGKPLDGGTLPGPDLIIQDELHLISGPLGTIAGVYEAAIDALCTRKVGGREIRPKIIASTATVRRAGDQIKALFGRADTLVFPPPGLDRRDSFFARTADVSETPARLYTGIAAQGRSLKVVFLRTARALLAAAAREYERAGGGRVGPANPADPYMTLLGYFSSLRELGGTRRIVEDEVRSQVEAYGRDRRRLDPADDLFADREILAEVLELTSRVSTDDVALAKRRLAQPWSAPERVDTALATNMISVGLDIQRLGLMLVLGQPKTSAEYIQATSRVGRQREKPGLVVTLLNIHRPRDRSHYERFDAFHAGFYRSVEASSVTPFSPRALDRALPAALVGLVRQGLAKMTPPRTAGDITRFRAEATTLVEAFAARAHLVGDAATADHVRQLCGEILDAWVKTAKAKAENQVTLQYARELKGKGTSDARLLWEFLNPEVENLDASARRFRANRSMRDVEPSADVLVEAFKKDRRPS